MLIKDFIAANLRNPQLSIDMLVKKFNCSRATLYRMFQSQGGVARYINRLRLQRCYKQLVSKKVKRSQKFSLSWASKVTRTPFRHHSRRQGCGFDW